MKSNPSSWLRSFRLEARYSVRGTTDLIFHLSATQRDVVKDIGFAALLQIPYYNRVNRALYTWLLWSMDTERMVLVLDDDLEIPVRPEEANRVLGLPMGKRPVRGVDELDRATAFLRIKSILGIPDDAPMPSTAGYEKIVASTHKCESQSEKEQFSCAFLGALVGNLLAPKGRQDRPHAEVYPAIAYPLQAAEFDWCSFLVEDMKQCSLKAKRNLLSGLTTVQIHGCAPFLQVLYMDNLAISKSFVQEDIRPRAKGYTNDVVGAILEVHMSDKAAHGFKKFLTTPITFRPRVQKRVEELMREYKEYQKKIRNNEDPVPVLAKLLKEYGIDVATTFEQMVFSKAVSWTCGSTKDDTSSFPCTACKRRRNYKQVFLPQTNTHHSGMKAGPSEFPVRPPCAYTSKSTGDLCHSESRYFSSEDNICSEGTSTNIPNNAGDTSGIGNLVPLDQSAPQSTRSIENTGNGHAATGSSVAEFPSIASNCQTYNTDHNSQQWNQEIMVTEGNNDPYATSMQLHENETVPPQHDISRSLAQTVPEITSAFQITGDKGRVVNSIYESSGSTEPAPYVLEFIALLPLPGERGNGNTEMRLTVTTSPIGALEVPYRVSKESVKAIANWIHGTKHHQEYFWTWISYNDHRHVTIDGAKIRTMLFDKMEVDRDICELAMGAFRSLEMSSRLEANEQVARHFLSPDWSNYVLCGVQPESEQFYKGFFSADKIGYDVSKCRLVIGSVNFDDTWSCYVWDFHLNRVHILDPSITPCNKGIRFRRHFEIAPALHGSLLRAITIYCGAVQMDPFNWEILIAPKIIEEPVWGRSGLYSLYCALEFDGVSLVHELTEGHLLKFRDELLYQMLHLPSNNGTLPTICKSNTDG